MNPDTQQICEQFLQGLPDQDWDQFKSDFSKLVTIEKQKRQAFCVVCVSDIDKLNSIKRFSGANLRSQIKAGKLEFSPTIFNRYVCDEHWIEYGLADLVEEYVNAKAEVDSRNEQRQAEDQAQKQIVQQKKNEQIHIWIKSRGKDGLAKPFTAFSWLISEYSAYKEAVYASLKSMPYSQFLKTDYWFIVSSYAKYKAGYKCKFCKSKYRLNTHHSTYENRGRELHYLDDLVVLCHSCHEHHHRKGEI